MSTYNRLPDELQSYVWDFGQYGHSSWDKSSQANYQEKVAECAHKVFQDFRVKVLCPELANRESYSAQDLNFISNRLIKLLDAGSEAARKEIQAVFAQHDKRCCSEYYQALANAVYVHVLEEAPAPNPAPKAPWIALGVSGFLGAGGVAAMVVLSLVLGLFIPPLLCVCFIGFLGFAIALTSYHVDAKNYKKNYPMNLVIERELGVPYSEVRGKLIAVSD